MFEKLKKIFSTKRQKNNRKIHHQPQSQIQTHREEKKPDKIAPSSNKQSNKKNIKTGSEKKLKQTNGYTKTGIKKIDPKEDLYLLFQADKEETKDHETKTDTEYRKSKRGKQIQRDKHGFPIFDKQNDYLTIFTGEKSGQSPKRPEHETSSHLDDSDDNFAELLNKSLKGKTVEELLAEKRDLKKSAKPLTVRQKIKMYPPPQAQLDLHGYSAAKAEEKTDTFLKNAYMRGTKTLLIIVGKGLHSEGHAVLPDVVESLLVRLKQSRIVLTYEWENRRKTKSGAVIVYLHKGGKL